MSPTYPTQHPRIYLTPHRARLQAALSANTDAARKFRAMVDQWVGGADLWGFQAWNAALLGQLTGEAAYCTKAVSTVESQVVAAEAAISAGQRPSVALDSYLEVGGMIGDLALVYDWCFDKVTPSQRARWIAYANQAVWNVWHPTEAKWGSTAQPWSGWSINNPSNNYYYSFLRATMLLGLATKGENNQADEWIAQFRDVKVLGQLVPTFEADLQGGGSREGTGYGTSMNRLYEMYQFWRSTTGENLADRTSHTRASFRAFMHQIVPTFDKVVPTGDHARDSSAALFDYHRQYLLELMMLYPTLDLSKRAKSLLEQSSVPEMSNGFTRVFDFVNEPTNIESKPLDGLGTVYYAPGIGEVYARSSWNKDATFWNLIAGPYTESHAHQDQGSLLLYKGGWLIYDANVQSKSGLSQETTSHSLVRIDQGNSPVKQVASTFSSVKGLAKGNGYVYAAADLTPAYKGHPAVQKVHREVVYLLPNALVVFDRVQSASGTTQTWQLAAPTQPALSGNTATITNAGHNVRITRIGPSSASASVFDYRSDSDMKGGYRYDERMPGGDQRYLHVLSVDGAVSSATAIGDTGVSINLAGGGTATVRFDRDAVGGTLTLNGTDIPLQATVQQMPE